MGNKSLSCFILAAILLLVLIVQNRRMHNTVRIVLGGIASLILTAGLLLQASDTPRSCRYGSEKIDNVCRCDTKGEDEGMPLRDISASLAAASLSLVLFALLFCYNCYILCYVLLVLALLLCISAIGITSTKSPMCEKGTRMIEGNCSCVKKRTHM